MVIPVNASFENGVRAGTLIIETLRPLSLLTQ